MCYALLCPNGAKKQQKSHQELLIIQQRIDERKEPWEKYWLSHQIGGALHTFRVLIKCVNYGSAKKGFIPLQ